MRLRASVLAVHGALVAWFCTSAQAEPSVIDLTSPPNTVVLGVGTLSSFSAKAEEYSGIRQKGGYVLADFDAHGGGPYDSEDRVRWSVIGRNLGLESRSLQAEYGVQGRFRVRLGYDELLRNQTDSYQTPYSGAGGNRLLLPSNWLPVVVPRVSTTTPNARGLSPDVTNSNAIVGGVSTPPTAAQIAAANALQAADLPAFQQLDLSTKRTRYGFAWDQVITGRWAFNAAGSHEHKDGLQPLGAQSRATNGDTSSILPVPIDQDDETWTVGVSYTGDALQLQAAYEGSHFRNNVPSVTWNLWAAPQINATMSTPPSNTFQKFLFSGSYQLSPTTNVVASASHALSTQNEPFLSDPTALLVPVTSADGHVVLEQASIKLFNRSVHNLTLSAGYRYDMRDNRTPVHTYGFYDNNNAPTGSSPFGYLFPQFTGLGQNFNLNANTPYSRHSNGINLDADYRLSSSQGVRVGFDATSTDRYCHNTWIQCADAPHSNENALHAEWRLASGPVQAHASLSGAWRRVDYDENAFLAVVPMAGQVPSTATGPLAGSTAYQTLVNLGLTGYGPVLGLNPPSAANTPLGFYFPLNNVLNNFLYGNENRISELIGMRRYNQADRDRAKLRSAVTWQASEALSLQGGLDYLNDNYLHSRYGLQKATDWAVNLEGSYVLDDSLTASLFASFEEQRSRVASNTYTANSTATNVNGATTVSGGCYATIAERNANNKIDPCLDWQSNTRDTTTTIGASLSKRRLMAGRLDLFGNVVYSLGRTAIDVTGGSYVNNPFAGVAGAPTGSIAATYIPASALPTNKVNALDLRIGGSYHLSGSSFLNVVYDFRRLQTSDWGYEGMQDGGLTQVLPTREQAPHYRVHSIGVGYQYSFR
jgi:MtrB/PioB family decaheme-associated outer membrane protein